MDRAGGIVIKIGSQPNLIDFIATLVSLCASTAFIAVCQLCECFFALEDFKSK
jgi:hypothetical protein